MFRRSSPQALDDPRSAGPAGGRWQPAPGEPHDTCFRCGRPTPLGVSLCEQDNPGHVKAPSSTQVHGTVALGVIAGFIGFMLLVGAVSGGVGPFQSAIAGLATQADGGLEVVIRVSNEGTRLAAASCRVSQGGVQTADDLVFFTELIPPGESRDFARIFAAPADGAPARNPARLAVRCN
ncbi:hypothetical protein BH24CHL6_BH24CHL6_00070 [soil metagenome]